MSDPQVTLYSDADYKGASSTLGVGRYATGFGLKNDSLSSIRVPSSLKVTLCDDANFGGRRTVVVRDTPNLNSANDKITSIIIEPAGTPNVIIYTDANYQGWGRELGVGSYNDTGIGNDSLTSVIVPAGYRVTLYEDGNYKGNSVVLTSDSPGLDNFNDRASSIIVDRIATKAPTLAELNQLIQQVAPRIYLHPDDEYGPSSVEWFLQRATLKKNDGQSIRASSAPLPAGGSDDGVYWLEGDSSARGGNLGSAVAYVNAKFHDGWLDLQFWFFYPYNGAGSANVTVVDIEKTIKLDPLGQHGGDWEHVTCRVDPISRDVRAMYLAQHSGGVWLGKGDIPRDGDGRIVAYSSRHGHASYSGTGSNLSNSTTEKAAGVVWFRFGLINSTAKSAKTLECNSKYQLLRADFLGDQLTAPDWSRFCRRWGPHITYKSEDVKNSIKSSLGGIPYADKAANAIWDAVPDEAKEENGPTGPWLKGSWSGNE